MRRIDITGQYKKDLTLARKRHLPEDELNKAVFNLDANELMSEIMKEWGTLNTK